MFLQLLAAGFMKPAQTTDAWGEIHSDITTEWSVGGEKTIQLHSSTSRNVVADSSASDRSAQWSAFTLRARLANLGNSSSGSESSSSADNSGGSVGAGSLSSAPVEGHRLSGGFEMRWAMRNGNSSSGGDSSEDGDTNSSDDSSNGPHLDFYFHHFGGNLSGEGSIDRFSIASGTFRHHHSTDDGSGVSGSLPSDGGGIDGGSTSGIGVGSGFNHGGIQAAPEPSSLALILLLSGAIFRRPRARG